MCQESLLHTRFSGAIKTLKRAHRTAKLPRVRTAVVTAIKAVRKAVRLSKKTAAKKHVRRRPRARK